jgi:GNAT superfamily N-acetyltransferase
MIRAATKDDTARIVEMGERFASETEYREFITVDPERVREVVSNLVESENGVIFVSGSDATLTGMIGLVIYDHVWSGEATAFEVVWWVEPEARGDGVRLLRAAEKWARSKGIEKMQMVAPNRKVGILYERCGYVPVETSYQRNL